jgi:hypothetical protein
MFTGQIPLFDDKPGRTSTLEGRLSRKKSNHTLCKIPEKCQHEYESLAEIYVLAEKLQDIKARNTTVEAIIAKVTHEVTTVTTNPCFPSLTAITTMYSKTPRYWPGRQVFLGCFNFYAEYDSLPETGGSDTLPREFLYDLACNALSYRAHLRSICHIRL